eukprot:GHVR01098175.1.p1 GENE.GHVR01098175.1~~GHVR01098175.1.p1  ORF type:complete len:243 (+),score=14.25 GHVR01098175.1:338-1066(+)
MNSHPNGLTQIVICDDKDSNMQNDESQNVAKSDHTEVEPPSCSSSRLCTSVHKHLDLWLCKDPVFIFFAVSLALTTMSYTGLGIMLQDIAITNGLTPEQGIIIISAQGVSDTLGRVLSGFLFSIGWIRHTRAHIYNLAIFTRALVCFSLAVMHSFWLMLIICVIGGLMTGLIAGQRTVMVIELTGLSTLPSSFGLTLFLQGALLLVGPVFGGKLTTSYSLIILGVTLIWKSGQLCSASQKMT